MGGKWLPFNINHENIINSMISLFVLSSPGDWPTAILQLIDMGSDDTGQ